MDLWRYFIIQPTIVQQPIINKHSFNSFDVAFYPFLFLVFFFIFDYLGLTIMDIFIRTVEKRSGIWSSGRRTAYSPNVMYCSQRRSDVLNGNHCSILNTKIRSPFTFPSLELTVWREYSWKLDMVRVRGKHTLENNFRCLLNNSNTSIYNLPFYS